MIRGFANDGLCDIRKRDCLSARLLGFNFVDSSNLKSRSTVLEVSLILHRSDIARRPYFAMLPCEE